MAFAVRRQLCRKSRKVLILKILEGILFLIHFVGASIGCLGRVDAMKVRLSMAVDTGHIGSPGLGVYSLVENEWGAKLTT
ncbi:hypothetical protein V8F06_010066 [Rhypophila decipiens]